MIDIAKKEKTLIAFTDPAGANAMLSVCKELIESGFVPNLDFFVVTNYKGKFNKLLYEFVKILNYDNENILFNLLDKFNVKNVISATSVNLFEHLIRKWAIKNNLFSVSFIDHWGPYLSRFSFNNEIILPSKIYVIDKFAYDEAIKELPKNKLFITENPYWNEARNFKPLLPKKEFLLNYGLSNYLVYIDEHIQECDDFIKDSKNIPLIGYNEFTVLTNLLNVLKDFYNSNIIIPMIIIKIHPISNQKKYDELIKKYNFLKIKIIQDISPLDIIYHSKFVVGMFSNLLIESYLIGKTVLRIQIGQKEDLFKLKRKEIKIIRSKNKLKKEILWNLKN